MNTSLIVNACQGMCDDTQVIYKSIFGQSLASARLVLLIDVPFCVCTVICLTRTMLNFSRLMRFWFMIATEVVVYLIICSNPLLVDGHHY